MAFTKTMAYLVLCAVSCVFLAAVPLTAKEADKGYLKTIINPRRAGVFVDGKYLGPSANFKIALKFPLSPGEHEVKLVEPRYEEYSTKLTIQAGKTTKLNQKLTARPPAKPPFGRLRTIADDKYAAVYVNDQFMGHTDEFSNSSQGLLLNPGDYTVKIAPVNGGPVHEEKIKIEVNKVTVVRSGK